MDTLINTGYKTYQIGNSCYEITREFNLQKSLKDIIVEKITSNNVRLHN